MGLSLSDVARDLGSMLGGGYVNRFINDGRSYRVIPQVERGERLNADQLLDYHIRGPQGQLISLSTIATLKHTVQPRSLNRFQQLNSIKITGVGPSIDGALKKLEAKAAEILPPGYSIDYGGQSRQLRNEGDRLLPALGLALCLALTIMVQTGIPWIGSLIFPFGFASIVLFGMELVTGNFALLPMAVWAGKTSWSKTFRNWIWVWIGNFLGTGLVGILFAISLTSGGTADLASGTGDWVAVANKIIGLNKANVIVKYQSLGALGFFLAFLRGLIANWLVCLGVTLALVSKVRVS